MLGHPLSMTVSDNARLGFWELGLLSGNMKMAK